MNTDTRSPAHQRLREKAREHIRKNPKSIQTYVANANKEFQRSMTPKEYLVDLFGFSDSEADELVARM